jgi:hypothetical protein
MKRIPKAEPVNPKAGQSKPKKLPIHPVLKPSCDPDTLARFKGGKYHPTKKEAEFHREFLAARPTITYLDQTDPLLSLHAYDQDDSVVLTPRYVAIDNGADIVAIISPEMATQLGLTWTPNTLPLVGVGGTSNDHAVTHQRLRMRIGCGPQEIDDEVIHLNITTEAVVSKTFCGMLGVDMVLGQGFLRTVLAHVDPYHSELVFAPLFHLEQCSGLRLRIPVRMADRPIPRIGFFQLEDQAVADRQIQVMLAQPVRRAAEKKPIAPTSSEPSAASPITITTAKQTVGSSHGSATDTDGSKKR